MSSQQALALVFLSACLTAGSARLAEAAGSPFQRLIATWAQLHGYTITVETTEWTGGAAVEEVLRYAFRKPDRARLEVVAGPMRGAILIWRGGQRVIAYRRGLSLFKVAAGVQSGRVTSPRGNGILTPNLGDVLDCFASRRDHVSEMAGPFVDGAPTDAITLDYGDGGTCPDDSAQDAAVTRDVLYVSRRSGYVVRRERYVRDSLVERYVIRDFSLDSELPDSLFR